MRSVGIQLQISKFVMYLFLMIGFVVSIYPFYWMLTASTLTESDIFKTPPRVWPDIHFVDNMAVLMKAMPFWRALFNSVFVSGFTTASNIYLAALAGFAFAKYRFKGKDVLFTTVMLSMLLPLQISLVPLFIIMTKLGWMNTYYALIVPFMVTPFGVFLMRQQMLSFPEELIESARIDGCNDWNIFIKIVLPTMNSACAALGIITFMHQWGNFIWPLIAVNSKEMLTIPLLLSMMVEPGNVVKYGAVMAGSVIGLLPMILLFLFFQKHFVSGMFSGSVKG